MLYFPTGNEAGAIDYYTIEKIGIPQMVLMERAALALADETEKICKGKDSKILVMAESGNNGGDGVALARILTGRGYRADVMCLNGLKTRSEAFMNQLKIAETVGVSIHAGKLDIENYDVIVDGIFGVGLSRNVEGVHADAIDILNQAEALKIAIDIPSGINSETGAVMGTAFKADYTVTFGFTKLGMLIGEGREYSGNIIGKDIGFPEKALLENLPKAYTFDNTDAKKLMPRRIPSSNKGTYGKVLVIAGSKEISGAAYLSAAAAYGMGAGLVKIFTEESNRRIMSELLPEALLATYDEAEPEKADIRESIKWASAVVIGPGIGQGKAAKLFLENVLLYAECPIILDADAINIMSTDKDHFDVLLSAREGKGQVIMTPHILEMSRFTGIPVPDIKKDIIKVAEETADKDKVIVVLKDARTVVSKPHSGDADNETTEGVYINTTGNSSMSKGGSGDVLTGVIAALIAQGAESYDAARLGVYLHGSGGDRAKEKLGEYGVMARDIIDNLSLQD